MKYFVLLIGILIQKGILSLIEAKQIYFHNNHNSEFFRRNRSNSVLEGNNVLLKNRSILNVIKRNDVQTDKCEEITTFSSKPGKIQLDDSDISKIKEIVQNKKSTESIKCAATIGLKPEYESVECYYAPGKIICKLGKYNFVINNGRHNMTRDIVEKFITMAYERYGEGDNCFDVAVDEVDTTPCVCYPTEIKKEPQQTPECKVTPVIIECNMVSNEKLKECNPNYEPTEKIYQCKAKTMGLKKRSLLNILIDDYNGKVSIVEDNTKLLARKKRECLNSQRKSILKSKKLLKRDTKLHSKFYQEIPDEDDDISNLYYNTKMPCVRNYTDLCTKHHQGNMLWCPSFRTFAIFCNSTTPSHLSSTESCVFSEHRRGKMSMPNPNSCTGNDCNFYSGGTTESNQLLQYNIQLPNRWKRYNYWRRRRKLQPWTFGNSRMAKNRHYINGRRSANIVRNGRLHPIVSNFAEAELHQSFNLNKLGNISSPITTCATSPITTCVTVTASSKMNPNVSTAQNQTWCTSVITVRCNASTDCIATTQPSAERTTSLIKSFKGMKNSSYKVELKKYNLTQLKENKNQKYAEMEQIGNQQMQMNNQDYSLIIPQQIKYNQMAMPGLIEPRTASRTIMGNIRSLENYPGGLHDASDPYRWRNQQLKMQYRPKRKMLVKKVSKFRRGQITRCNSNRKDPQMYDELVHK